MATSKNKDDKVFDVSKPGKSAASASSRPLIVGHKSILKDPMVKEKSVDELVQDETIKIEQPVADSDKPSGSPPLPVVSESTSSGNNEKMSAPSESKVVIKPMSDSKKSKNSDNQAEDSKVDVKVNSKATKVAVVADDETEDTISEDSKEEDAPADESDKTESEEETSGEEAESKAEEDTSEDKPDEKSETSEAEDNSSEAPAALEAQKKADKEFEEAAAKKAQLEKVVDSKQYFVPIGEKTRKRRSLKHILLGAFLILLLGGALAYLMIDVGIVKANINLPYHFFKQTATTNTSSIASETPNASTTAPKTSTAPTYKTTTTVPSDWKKYSDPKTKLSFYYPSDWTVTARSVVYKNKEGTENVYSDNAKTLHVFAMSPKTVTQMTSGRIEVFDQPLNQSVAQLIKYLKGVGNSASNPITNVKATNILFKGKKAVETQFFEGTVTGKQIFVDANGFTYALPQILSNETNYQEVLTITESVKID